MNLTTPELPVAEAAAAFTAVGFAAGVIVGLVRHHRLVWAPRQPVRTVWSSLCSGIRWSAGALVVVVVVTMGASTFGTVTGNWRVTPILSESMSPHLHKGDAAVVVPLDPADLRVGDVVVFNAPAPVGFIREGDPVIHRVIEVVDPADLTEPATPGAVYVRTKGDANRLEDPWIVELEPGDVWGQVATARHVGDALSLVAGPKVRIGLLLVAAMVLFAAAFNEFRAASPSEQSGDDVTGTYRADLTTI